MDTEHAPVPFICKAFPWTGQWKPVRSFLALPLFRQLFPVSELKMRHEQLILDTIITTMVVVAAKKVQTEWSEIIHFTSHERLLFWAPFSLARCLVELTDNRPQNYTTSPEIYSINQLKPALSVLIRSAQSVTHAHTWVLCNRCFRMSGLLMAAVDPNPSSQSARNICTTSPTHSLSLSLPLWLWQSNFGGDVNSEIN